MSLITRTDRGIRASRRPELRRFARWANQALNVPHPVRLRFVEENALSLPTSGPLTGPSPTPGRFVFGVFVYPDPGYTCVLRVYVVAGPVLGLTEVIGTALHELAHYERWRDGRSMNERGIEARARGLYRRYLREVVCK